MNQTVKEISLDQLPVGSQATIVRVGGEKTTKRRLLDMGLLPGEKITVKATAPLGDPLEMIIKGYHLSLRKHEAREITVQM